MAPGTRRDGEAMKDPDSISEYIRHKTPVIDEIVSRRFTLLVGPLGKVHEGLVSKRAIDPIDRAPGNTAIRYEACPGTFFWPTVTVCTDYFP